MMKYWRHEFKKKRINYNAEFKAIVIFMVLCYLLIISDTLPW